MENIVIHILKTGGTTLIMNIFNLNCPPEPNINYRHLNNIETGSNNCLEFVNNYEQYKDSHNIISFIRDPFERLYSEYCFFCYRQEFQKLYNENDKFDFSSYVNNEKNYNSIIKFLLGLNLFDKTKITEMHYNKVVNILESSKFIFCVTEEFSKSLELIEFFLKKPLNKKIKNYRQNLNKPKLINKDEIKLSFIKNNFYDLKLYNYWIDKFNSQYLYIKKKTLTEKDFIFNNQDSKYHHFFIFTNYPKYRCPINIFNLNSQYVNKNEDMLKKILIIAKNKNDDGKKIAISWIEIFAHVNKIDVDINYDDPIETIKYISSLENFK